MQIEPKLLTISQAAGFLGVSKDTLRRWEKSGLISPFRTAGKNRRYTWEDLKAARFQKGRRIYRMKQLLSSNKAVVKTVFFTSLFWILIILALKITNISSPTSILPPVLSDIPKTDLRYSDKPDQYFSLKPLPENPIPTLIKRI